MKKIIKIVMAIVVVSLTFGLIFTSEKNFVKAATPTNYLLKVDYTKSFIGYGMPSPTITNGSDSVLEAGSYYPKTLKITLKKPLSKESTVEAASGSIFNFNSVSIFVETDYTIL